MFLVYRALEGESVPMSLPPPLVPPSKRKKPTAAPVMPLLPSPPSVKDSRSSHTSAKTLPHPPKPAPAPAPTPAAAPVSTASVSPVHAVPAFVFLLTKKTWATQLKWSQTGSLNVFFKRRRVGRWVNISWLDVQWSHGHSSVVCFCFSGAKSDVFVAYAVGCIGGRESQVRWTVQQDGWRHGRLGVWSRSQRYFSQNWVAVCHARTNLVSRDANNTQLCADKISANFYPLICSFLSIMEIEMQCYW